MKMTRHEDNALIQLVLAGDQAAAEKLHRQYLSTVLGSLSMVRPEDKEDQAQVAFQQVFSHLGSFRGHSSLATWIYRIGLNVGLSHLRATARETKQTLSLDDTLELESGSIVHEREHGSQDPAIDSISDRDLIRRVLAMASPSDRFYLEKLMEGHGPTALAELTGESLANTKSNLHRSLKRARRRVRLLLAAPEGEQA